MNEYYYLYYFKFVIYDSKRFYAEFHKCKLRTNEYNHRYFSVEIIKLYVLFRVFLLC